MSSFYDSIDILRSGLSAQKMRVDISSSNMANAKSTGGPNGEVYQRRDPVFMAIPLTDSENFDSPLHKVAVKYVQADASNPQKMYQPNHPDADEQGYIFMPNINTLEELMNMMEAQRSYESHISSIHAIVQMSEKTLEIGR
jgi:flagellar basal-body rod protein FlgC